MHNLSQFISNNLKIGLYLFTDTIIHNFEWNDFDNLLHFVNYRYYKNMYYAYNDICPSCNPDKVPDFLRDDYGRA